jgi:hypothetical protein
MGNKVMNHKPSVKRERARQLHQQRKRRNKIRKAFANVYPSNIHNETVVLSILLNLHPKILNQLINDIDNHKFEYWNPIPKYNGDLATSYGLWRRIAAAAS